MPAPTDLAAALLRDVPSFNVTVGDHTDPSVLLLETDVLAALSAHLDADLITALLAQNAALRSERDKWEAAHTEACKQWQNEYRICADALKAAEAEAEKLRVLLEGWLELASQCDIAEGVCCCGESMEGHSNPMDCGHTPLDHGTYIAVQLGKETRAALTTEERHDG